MGDLQARHRALGADGGQVRATGDEGEVPAGFLGALGLVATPLPMPDGRIASDAWAAVCPACGKKLTIGVMHRVEKLADRPEGKQPEGLLRHRSAVPLTEMISDLLGVGEGSKAVSKEYAKLLATFGSEFAILLEVSSEDIGRAGYPLIAEAIAGMRKGKVEVEPGYDGVYGRVRVKA